MYTSFLVLFYDLSWSWTHRTHAVIPVRLYGESEQLIPLFMLLLKGHSTVVRLLRTLQLHNFNDSLQNFFERSSPVIMFILEALGCSD